LTTVKYGALCELELGIVKVDYVHKDHNGLTHQRKNRTLGARIDRTLRAGHEIRPLNTKANPPG